MSAVKNHFFDEINGTEPEWLHGELKAALGYLLNAKIDLETGAPKATAIRTLEGGIRRIRASVERSGKL